MIQSIPNPTKINVSRALLRLISVTVFNFTHPPVLSALLLILSASRFLAPDYPLLVPAPFLFSVNLRGMTFPFLSDRNPLWTHSLFALRIVSMNNILLLTNTLIIINYSLFFFSAFCCCCCFLTGFAKYVILLTTSVFSPLRTNFIFQLRH